MSLPKTSMEPASVILPVKIAPPVTGMIFHVNTSPFLSLPDMKRNTNILCNLFWECALLHAMFFNFHINIHLY